MESYASTGGCAGTCVHPLCFPPVVTRCLPQDNPPRAAFSGRSRKYTYCAVASSRARRNSRRNPPTPPSHCRTSSLDRDHSRSFFAHCLVQRDLWDRENRGPKIPVAGDASKSIYTVRHLISCFQYSFNADNSLTIRCIIL